MSHVATIDIRVQEDCLDALAKACETLGLELMRNQKTYRWYGRWVQDYHAANAAYKNGIKPEDYGHCEHAIRIKGDTTNYEIGLMKAKDGNGYQLVWDFWGSGQKITAMMGGQAGGRLKAQYAKEVTIQQAKNNGFTVTEGVDQYGNIEITLEDNAYTGQGGY
jgi:hypothetical protein